MIWLLLLFTLDTWYVGITITFQLSLWSLEGRTLIVSNYNTKLRLIWCGEEEGGLCFYVNNSPAQNLFAVVNVVSFSSVFLSCLTTLIVVSMLCLTQRSYEKDLLIYFTFIISIPYTESFQFCFWATRSQICLKFSYYRRPLVLERERERVTLY